MDRDDPCFFTVLTHPWAIVYVYVATERETGSSLMRLPVYLDAGKRGLIVSRAQDWLWREWGVWTVPQAAGKGSPQLFSLLGDPGTVSDVEKRMKTCLQRNVDVVC